MRNDYIGTSIDGDHAVCCQRYGHAAAPCGCDNRPNRSGCGNCQPRSGSCEQSARCNPERDCNPRGKCPNERDCNPRNQCHNDRDCNPRNQYPGERDCTPRNQGHNERDCNARSGCADEHDCHHRPARQDCDCSPCTSAYAFCDHLPGMVYAADHDLDSIYCGEKALMRGTLFGCLDKPMCNERCNESPCITQCQADQFAIWELRLYLNTHPCDQKALALMHSLLKKLDDDCGCAYTPDCNRWSWTDGPWPWEYQRCCGKEA